MLYRRFLLALAVLAAVPALLQANFYMKGSLLLADSADFNVSSVEGFNSSLDSSVGYGFALGYKFAMLRAEAEVLSFSGDIQRGSADSGATTDTTGDVENFRLMVNGYFDLPQLIFINPYIGVGVGYGTVDLNNFSYTSPQDSLDFRSSDESFFGYQVMIGVDVSLVANVNVSAGYRYISTDGFDTDNIAATLTRAAVDVGDSHVFEVAVTFGY